MSLRTGPTYGWPVGLAATIALLAWLLATTPGDAIRLRRRLSEGLILSGTLYLLFAASLIASTQRPGRMALASFIILCGTVVMLAGLRRRDTSAWWAVLVAWNPLTLYMAGVMARIDAAIALLAGAIIVLIAGRRGPR